MPRTSDRLLLVDPVEGLGDGLLPLRVRLLAVGSTSICGSHRLSSAQLVRMSSSIPRTRRPDRPRRRRRARWSRRPPAGSPARRGCRPGTASAVSLTTMPPSTFSAVRSTPESAFIASSTSRVWNAVDSSTARARWPLLTNRVRPTIAPRASDRQYGANRPENAGTKYAPPLSSTVLASVLDLGGAAVIMPRLSRTHCTSEPVTAIEPSSAYTGRLVADLVADGGQQAVLRRHLLGAGVEQHEVAGAVGVLGLARRTGRPGRTSPPAGRRGCRRSARRPARRARGPCRRPPTRTGSPAASTSGCPSPRRSSASQVSVSRSISMVREALVGLGDVQAAVDAAGHVPDHPGVHVAEDQVAGLGLLPGALDVVEDPADLRPGEVGGQRQADLGLVALLAAAERAQLAGRSCRCGCPARRWRCRPARRWSGPRPPRSRAGW